MSRYIDTDILKQQDFQDYSKTDVEHAIDNCPTADVVPRKRGMWVYGVTMNRGWMKCNQCLVSQSPNGCFGYCPNCGAEMDGERSEK